MATVLVVDDEELVRYSVRLMLEDEGHEVVEAVDGVQGLACLAAGNFDILVTDVVMPAMRGLDIIVEAKRRWPNLGIVAMSGSGVRRHLDYLAMAEQAGADIVLAKPFARQELADALRALL